ncbi:hypothetical protein ACHAXR_010447, partial [Thalassiosira sp. AJA248-18]
MKEKKSSSSRHNPKSLSKNAAATDDKGRGRRHTETSKRRSSDEKKPRRHRRLSQDDMDIDHLMRRYSNQREEVLKNHAKDDNTIRRKSTEKKPSSSAAPLERKKSTSSAATSHSRRRSAEKKELVSSRAPPDDDKRKSTEKKSTSAAASPPRRRSLEIEKKDIGTSSKHSLPSSERDNHHHHRKSSLERTKSTSSSSKQPAGSSSRTKPRRRPSVDDFAVDEYKKIRNRRKSEESQVSHSASRISKVSKDDLELFGEERKSRSSKSEKERGGGERGKQHQESSSSSKKNKKSSNLERFEEMCLQDSSSHNNLQDSPPERKRRGEGGESTSSPTPEQRETKTKTHKPRRSSKDNDEKEKSLHSRPRKRESHGSEDRPPLTSMRISSLDVKKRDSKSRRLSHGSSGRYSFRRSTLGSSGRDSFRSSSYESEGDDDKDDKNDQDAKKDKNSHKNRGVTKSKSRRSSDPLSESSSSIQFKLNRLSLDETTNKKGKSTKAVYDSMKVVTNGKAMRRNNSIDSSDHHIPSIPKSLDPGNLEPFEAAEAAEVDHPIGSSSPRSKSSTEMKNEEGVAVIGDDEINESINKRKSRSSRNTERSTSKKKGIISDSRSKRMMLSKKHRATRRMSESSSSIDPLSRDDLAAIEASATATANDTTTTDGKKRRGSKFRKSSHRKKEERTSYKNRRPSLKNLSSNRRKKSSSGVVVSSSELRRPREIRSSSHDDEAVSSAVSSAEQNKTEPGEATSEMDSYLAKRKGSSRSSKKKSSKRSRKSSSGDNSIGLQEERIPEVERRTDTTTTRQRKNKRKWQCLCCCMLVILLAVAVVAAYMVLEVYDLDQILSEDTKENQVTSGNGTEAPSIFSTNLPSAPPSMVPTPHATSLAPTSSPLANVAIVVLVQLDAKPEETGFSLTSADNSTTYISRPIGSLSGLQSEVVMEVISIVEGTELVFTIEDEFGDGLCCTYGTGYYRVLAGTGDQKITMLSGEQSAKYVFTVGMQHALQIGGVDPNEYCKPCPDGKDCGRCAWCNADEGFLQDTIFSYQCQSGLISIPKKCFIGDKRFRLHNQYVAAMAGCSNDFEARPQIQSSPETTICVEEAKCVKEFFFFEPDCDQELGGSLLVKETCQDKIGGIPFGYSWGLNAPREKECLSSDLDFATSLAQRCCVDGEAFCTTFNENGDEENVHEETAPTPMPAGATTYAPTTSSAPTWDGYPITVLIQTDDFPRENGFSITSADKQVTYLERHFGLFNTLDKKSQLVVEKVQIPQGTNVILTLTDSEGDGMCCENGNGYIQVYADNGSLILDEEATFSTFMSRTFLVGEPETEPPTVSASPSSSTSPSFDQFPITIAVQLDQWSSETGFSIEKIDGSYSFFEWPAESFSGQPSTLVEKTVYLPRDAEAILRVTDTGGDGFCCLYGEGYVKIFAGESIEDESALLAFEYGEFESDLSITFRAGPAPSLAPATTTIPTASNINANVNSPTSLNACPEETEEGCIEMTVVLQLDKYSAETGFSIDSSDGLTNFVARSDGYYEDLKSQKIIETVQLPKGLEYQFTITDFMGDGTCCWAGQGWYSLYEGNDIEDNSTQVFYGIGDFGRERVHMFVAGKPKTLSPTSSRSPSENPTGSPSMKPSHSSMPSVTTYALEVTIKLDNDSSQTGWYIATDDGTVIIDRPPGYYNGNDTLTTVETVKLEAGEYQFSLLDTEGDGFCCQQGFGFYSVYSNGDLLLFREARFEYSYNETFSILPDANDAGSSSKSSPMLRGSVNALLYNLHRQRKHKFANIFNALGVEDVNILIRGDVETSTKKLGMDLDVANELMRLLKGSGVKILEGTTVDEFSYVPPPGADDELIQMKLNDGSTMETDLFFAATGRYPVGKNEDTGLASAGVDIADRGMVNIDKKTLITSSKNVYAAGDVIGAPALASTSMEQAQRAVSSMFCEGGDSDVAKEANHDEPLSIGVWTIPEMGYYGLTKEQAERDGYSVVEGSVGFDQCLRGRVFAPDGLLKLVVDSDGGTVLGVHIIGKEAAEMVHY